MNFTQAHQQFIADLRRNPALPAPLLRVHTPAGLQEWKTAMRAFDAAQLELKIAKPADIQRRNTAVAVKPGAKIVRHAKYA